jgi:hypothetical protein
MKVNYAHICESASVSSNGNPNFIGVFNGIAAREVPTVHKQASIVINFNPEDTDPHKIKVEILSPSGKEVIKPVEGTTGPAPSKNGAIGYILNVVSMGLDEVGRYSIKFFVDDKLIHVLYFDLELIK